MGERLEEEKASHTTQRMKTGATKERNLYKAENMLNDNYGLQAFP